jgi:hypothetical protein
VVTGGKTDKESGQYKDNDDSLSRETAEENLNEENTLQNICPLDSQILILMEKRDQNIYFV